LPTQQKNPARGRAFPFVRKQRRSEV